MRVQSNFELRAMAKASALPMMICRHREYA